MSLGDFDRTLLSHPVGPLCNCIEGLHCTGRTHISPQEIAPNITHLKQELISPGSQANRPEWLRRGKLRKFAVIMCLIALELLEK